MRVLLVVAVLALALLVSAEPLDLKKKIGDLAKKVTGPHRSSLGSRRPGSGSGSGSSSGLLQGKPELMAKEIVAVFGDADGSAYFKVNKILPDTVAEVPPRKKAPIRKPHTGSSRSAQSHRFRAPFLDDLKKKLGPKKPDSRRPDSHRSSSSRSQSVTNPRHRRKLFNFNSVPAGVTGVGLRKHNFGTKHHSLLVRFCNSHAKITTVIVVDKFIGPKGRPSKKGGDRRRGNKQSDLRIVGLKHKNLFVFNDKFEQVFPAKKGSSDSKKSSSSKGTAPPRPSAAPIAPPPSTKASPPGVKF